MAVKYKTDRIASDVLECPHCGYGKIRIVGTDRIALWFSCNRCNASGPVKSTIEEARAAWNKRVSIEPIHEQTPGK